MDRSRRSALGYRADSPWTYPVRLTEGTFYSVCSVGIFALDCIFCALLQKPA